MSKNNQKTNNNFKRIIDVVDKNGHVYSNICGSTLDENAAAVAVTILNIAKKYQIDVCDVIDHVLDTVDDFFDNPQVRKNTGDKIWKEFIRQENYDGTETMEDFYDCFNLPGNEIPLYVASYDPEEECYHFRNNIESKEAMMSSIESLQQTIEVLGYDAGFCPKHLALRIAENIEKDKDCKNCNSLNKTVN